MLSAFARRGPHGRLTLFWNFPAGSGSETTWPVIVPLNGHFAVPPGIVASFNSLMLARLAKARGKHPLCSVLLVSRCKIKVPAWEKQANKSGTPPYLTVSRTKVDSYWEWHSSPCDAFLQCVDFDPVASQMLGSVQRNVCEAYQRAKFRSLVARKTGGTEARRDLKVASPEMKRLVC